MRFLQTSHRDLRDLFEREIVARHIAEPLVSFDGDKDAAVVTAHIVQVNAYERCPEARQECIEHYGTTCVICGFNFEEIYGSVAKDFIHVHHRKPLASIGEKYVIHPIKDMRPVCPNCHAVIHLRKKPYSVKEVEKMISGKRKRGRRV